MATDTPVHSYNAMQGFDIKTILKPRSKEGKKLNTDIGIIDNDWVQSRFIVPDINIPETLVDYRYASSATYKYTDSALGGNIHINPRPQFTRYCDIRAVSKIGRSNGVSFTDSANVTIAPLSGNKLGNRMGMGRYYSEAIDDNQQTVFMEFGLPRFNSMTDFFLRAIDYSDSILANTGRSSFFYNAGQAAGYIGMLIAFPMITIGITAFKLMASLFTNANLYNYYYLAPHMHLYWSTVNQLVTQLGTELGLLSPVFSGTNFGVPTSKEELDALKANPNNGDVVIGNTLNLDTQAMSDIRDYLPDGMISENNYIDMFAIATRAQRVANIRKAKQNALYEQEGIWNILTKEGDIVDKALSIQNKINDNFTFEAYFKDLAQHLKPISAPDDKLEEATKEAKVKEAEAMRSSTTEEKKEPTEAEIAAAEEAKKAKDKQNKQEAADAATTQKMKQSHKYKETVSKEQESWATNFLGAVDATARQGGAYAVFGVDFTGSVSESFSNSTGTINTGDTIKQASSRARNLKFDLAGGNMVNGMDSMLQGAKAIVAGVLDSVSFGLSSVIQTMTGGAFIDIPKKWDDSSASFPSVSYSMQLISPYGNTISQLQNMYIPLCMILAGVLPLSTGKSSYTSPFLCSLYSKGVQNIRLGMITDVSITRGTSNLAFNKNRRPLALDITFQVTDFSTLITAPVSSDTFSRMIKTIGNVFTPVAEDDTPLGNYLSVLGGRDLLTSKYAIHKAKLRISKVLMDFDQATSAASWGMRGGSIIEGALGPVLSVQSLTSQHINR